MLVQYPRIREAPAEVVRGLSAVDPRVQVLWWGPTLEVEDRPVPGRQWATRPVSVVKPAWLVGFVDPYRVGNAIAAARCKLYQEAPLRPMPFESDPQFAQRVRKFHQKWSLARLAYQGFTPQFFWFARDLDSELVFAYEEMGWFARTLFETMQKQAMAEFEKTEESLPLTERQRLIREAVRAAMPEIWRHTFRGRRSFLVPSKAVA